MASNPDYKSVLDIFYDDLKNICDPEAVNLRAKKEQEEKIRLHGGIDNIMERGDFGYSPAPGQKPKFD